jgi:hypothetical protein
MAPVYACQLRVCVEGIEVYYALEAVEGDLC